MCVASKCFLSNVRSLTGRPPLFKMTPWMVAGSNFTPCIYPLIYLSARFVPCFYDSNYGHCVPLYTLYCTYFHLIVSGANHNSQDNTCKSKWFGAGPSVYLPLRGERCRWCVPTDTIAVTLQETAQVCKRALLEIHTKRPVPSHQLPARHTTHTQSSHENNVK